MSTTQLSLLMRWLNYSHLTSPIAYGTADTKILLHAVDSTSRGAYGISVHSPDTGVLVLAVRRYPLLCLSITFVTGTGQKRRSIPLKPIYDALGPMKAAALQGFHAKVVAIIWVVSLVKEKQLSGKLSSMLLMIFFKRLERLVQEKWNHPVLRRVMP